MSFARYHHPGVWLIQYFTITNRLKLKPQQQQTIEGGAYPTTWTSYLTKHQHKDVDEDELFPGVVEKQSEVKKHKTMKEHGATYNCKKDTKMELKDTKSKKHASS